MLSEPGLELRVGRLGDFDHVVHEERHLPAHPAPDDGVVLIDAQSEALAVERLLEDVVVHQAAQFFGVGRPLPGLGEQRREILDAARRNDDLAAARLARALVQERVDREHQHSEEDEVEQRLG